MQNNPGKEAAEKVRQACEILLKEKKILGFHFSRDNGELDSAGIDFLIYLHGGLIYFGQIKSRKSGGYFKKVVEEHHRKHPLVRDVYGITQRDQPWRIALRIRKKINKMIRRTKELQWISERYK